MREGMGLRNHSAGRWAGVVLALVFYKMGVCLWRVDGFMCGQRYEMELGDENYNIRFLKYRYFRATRSFLRLCSEEVDETG